MLAAERAQPEDLARMQEQVEAMRDPTDFSVYRRADVFFHLGIAEAAQSPRLVAAMTEVQGQMSELIAHIAHPRAGPCALQRPARGARGGSRAPRRLGGRAARPRAPEGHRAGARRPDALAS